MGTDITSKSILTRRGECIYLSSSKILVKLYWTSQIDLDLMAFFKSRDGQIGGVFSPLYPHGNLGSLNSFPFISLDRDMGVGAIGGENEETIYISKVSAHEVIYIVVFDYTDVMIKRPAPFSLYAPVLYIADMSYEGYTISLTHATGEGNIILACSISSSSDGREIIVMVENRIMYLNELIQIVPGSNLILS